MPSTSVDVTQAVRTHRALFAGQLALTAVAVGLSKAGLGTRTTMVLIVLTAVLNASLVAYTALGLRQQWKPVYVVLGVMAVTGVALLFWPAWGVVDRVRFH